MPKIKLIALISFLFISILFTCSFSKKVQAVTYNPKYDLNYDNQISLLDIFYLINVIFHIPKPSPNVTPTISVTKTPTPTPTATKVPTPVATPSPIASSTPLPSVTPAGDIGPINLTYRQGGIWITPDEIKQIPDSILTTTAWKNLVTWANTKMDFYTDLTYTSGGAGSYDCKSGKAMYARVIVGYKTNNQTMINEVIAELDKVDEAINKAIDVDKNTDIKWAERNIPYIAVSANIINYKPQTLKDSLNRAIRVFKFPEGTVEYESMLHQSNKPSHGRWALLSVAYLNEDFATVNKVVKAEAKGLGEPNWGGVKNDHQFELSGLGNDDNWQTLQPGGKANPLFIMPAGITYNGHGVGGLYLADQYRAANGPQWPPSFTNYTFEGMGPNIAIAWSADHLGYKDVFKWGNYAFLRSMLFQYSTHGGKAKWTAVANDAWEVAAIMTWVRRPNSGITGTPTNLMPEPGSSEWPLTITDNSSDAGRSMGFMYVTHYARLIGL